MSRVAIIGARTDRLRAVEAPAAVSPSAPTKQPGRVPAVPAGTGRAPAAGGMPAPATSHDAVLVHCPECGREVKASGLGVHRRYAHGHKVGSRGPINCPDCGESIAQKKNLARHRRVSHGIVPWQPTPILPAKGAPVLRKGAETFLCDRCTDRFTSREALTLHRTSHPEPPRGKPVGAQPVAEYATGGGTVLG